MAGNVLPEGYEAQARRAVAHYWATRQAQARRQQNQDVGNRRSVTGGKQLDGFAELVRQTLAHNGLSAAGVVVGGALELPGYFRPTKKWDLLALHEGRLVAALEFRSQAGPSFGNNFNNRCEEAIGNATDFWAAFRKGALGVGAQPPWVGGLVLLEDCDGSRKPVRIKSPHFQAFEEFQGASYARRYELLLRKLTTEKLYNGAALLLAECRSEGDHQEPTPDLSVRRFLEGLGEHTQAFLAGA